MDEQQFDVARSVLHELHAKGPRHVATLRLLLRAEQGLEHWDEVLRLVHLLEKRGAMAPPAAREVRSTATLGWLRQKGIDAQSLHEFWRSLAEEERTVPSIAALAAQLFMRLGACPQAHGIIAAALAVAWSPELVLLYGKDRDEDAAARLETAQRWLAARPRDAALLLTLGRLCLYREQWDPARDHLEASLSVQPTRAAHVELALLAVRTGRSADAARHHHAAGDAHLPD